MRASIYARVSDDSQDYSEQIAVLKDWANCRGFEVVRVFCETESAWKAGHQKELKRLMQFAYQRRTDVILVWALDRLSREGPLAILKLVHKLKSYSVQVLSYQEPWTEAPGEIGDLLYALTGWVAQMESQRRSERTKAGLSRVKAQGKRLGRPPGSKDRKKRKGRQSLVGYFDPLPEKWNKNKEIFPGCQNA